MKDKIIFSKKNIGLFLLTFIVVTIVNSSISTYFLGGEFIDNVLNPFHIVFRIILSIYLVLSINKRRKNKDVS